MHATPTTDRVSAWLERLSHETDQATHSAELTAYFTAMARFWDYSYNNQILIWQKRPTATRVGGRTTLWEPLGYTVKRDEWPNKIWIQRPKYVTVTDNETGEKSQVHVGYTWVYVFDISQVEAGPNAHPLDAPWVQIAGDHAALYDLLHAVCTNLEITIELREDLPQGVLGRSNGKGQIALAPQPSRGNMAQTLVHEMAHELVHPSALRPEFGHQEVECQAEAIAYCVAQALGMETPNSPTYLALYGVTADVLKANALAIHHGVARLLREVERVSQSIHDAAVAA